MMKRLRMAGGAAEISQLNNNNEKKPASHKTSTILLFACIFFNRPRFNYFRIC